MADPLASHSINVTSFPFARGRLHAAWGRTKDALRDFAECGRRSALLGRVSVLYHRPAAAVLTRGRVQRARARP